MLNLLQIVEEAVVGTGVRAPSSIVSGNEIARQLLRLSNTIVKEIATRHKWEALNTEGTFTAVSTELQFAMATQFPYFREMINNTFWNRTKQSRVRGALSAEEWQRVQATNVSPSTSYYRVRGGNLYLSGGYDTGDTMTFEYISKKVVLAVDGTTTRESFEADTDVPLLDDQAMILGLRWRWRHEKGLEYSEHFRAFEERIEFLRGGDSEAETLSYTPRRVRGHEDVVGITSTVSEAPPDWSMDSTDLSG